MFFMLAASAAAQVTASSHTVITNSLGSTTGLAVDQLGNLLAADSANNALVQLQGSNSAPATVLSGLSAPQQVAVDLNRNVYIANGTSNQVVEIPYQAGALNGNAPILLGKGLGTVVGVAVDLSGNVYAVDATNKQVVKIAGTTQTVILTGLSAPRQIAVDRLFDVFVADAGANTVVELPTGGVQTNLGTGLNAPVGVATDPSNNLYIADTGNGRLLKLPVGGAQTVLLSGVASPGAIATDTRGSVYIASGNSILRFTQGGIYFGLLPVGTPSQTFPVTVTFGSNITPAAIKVLTTGTVGLDFKDAGSDSCSAGVNFAVGSTCVINVTFTPGAVGPRYGAIVFYASNNQVLGRIYLGGGGQGALVTSDPGSLSTITPSVQGGGAYSAITTPRGLTVDASGNIFLAEYGYTNGTTEVGPPRISELPVSSQITAYSVSASGVATFTVNNNFTTGENITLSGFTKSTFFNNLAVTVLSATSTQFTANVPATDDNLSATENGLAYPPATVIANTSTNGVAINGAGDLIVASGAATLTSIPYENGTWNFANVATLATGYSRIRDAKVDVAGDVFWCDAGTNGMYELPAGATAAITLPDSKYSTSCLGVAVDLYGNLAFADNTSGKVLYVPVSGATPYETGSGFTSAWGVAFDPSGSIWETASGAALLGRIPNENGVLVGGDQINSTVGSAKDYGLWVDNSGNLYTAQDSGSDVTSFTIINRSVSPLTFTASTAIGSTNATTLTAYASNSGNLPVTWNNGGTVSLFDIDDFPQKTATNPCNFNVPFVQGFTCGLAFGFTPLSSGTRTASVDFTSSALSNSVINLTGTATGTVSGTATLTLALTTPASGSPAPGQALTLSATAKSSGASTPTGALTFSIDGKAIQAVEMTAGVATFNIAGGLTAGTHLIGITYEGDKANAPVTTAVTTSITVVLATSTVNLIASGSEVGIGQSASFTATIPTQSGLATPTGTVVFTDTTNNSTIGTGTVNSAGVATVSTTTLAAGTHTVVASYSGDSVYTASTSAAVTVMVGNYAASTTTLVVTPAQPAGGYPYGQPITGAITVAPASGSGTPTGSVSCTLDGTPQVLTLSAGKATLNLTNVSAGAHVLDCFYSGDATYASSTSPAVSFMVVKAVTTTSLSTSTTAALAAQSVTLTAHVSSSTSTPGGSVQFLSGLSVIGTAPLAGGVATLTTTLLPAGTDSVTAAYVGDANDSPSTSTPMTIVITLVQSTLTLTASPSVALSGSTAVLTATLSAPVTATYSGSITFYSGSTVLGTSNVSGSGAATFTTSALTAATNSFTASYSGSAIFTASTSAAPAIVYITNASGAGVTATTTLGSGFSSAAGVAVDLYGNVYVDDAAKGNVDLIAGGAGAQSAPVTGLKTTAGLAVDGAGDLYIANGVSNQVLEYTSAAGALSTSSSKKIGSNLGTIVGVAVDNAGNVYVTDATNKQVVKISSAGVQTALNQTLVNPQQVAVDTAGNVYVADGTGNRVIYITAAGVSSTIGTGLVDPTGVAVDAAGNIYIADTGNNRVVKIPFVSGVPATASQTTLIPTITAPGQLAVDRHTALYITQSASLFKWQANAASLGVLAPGSSSPTYTLTFNFQTAVTPASINVLTSGVAGGEFQQASGSTCAAGTAYAVGQSCTIAVTFTPALSGIRSGAVVFASTSGQPLLTAYLAGVGYAPQLTLDNGTSSTIVVPAANLGGTAPGNQLRGFTTDPAGNLYVCDASNGRVFEINAANTAGTVLNTSTSCSSLALDGAGNLLVDNTSNVLLLPNENGVINGNDAFVVASGFAGSRGMGFDGFGNLYVADSTNVRVLIAPIGQPATANVVPPLTLKSSYDVAVDWLGNIAVADNTAGSVVYLPSATSVQTTIGPTLCGPYALAMDPAGSVYVTEASAQNATTCVGTPTTGSDVVRIAPATPNVYTQPVGHASGPEGIYIDPRGNLITEYGTEVVSVNRNLATLAFPSTAVGATSAPLTTLLSNSGPAPVTPANPSFTLYLDSADFAVPASASCPASGFAAGASCTLSFTFDPVQAGARSADYAPLSNSASTPLISLTGTGTGGSASTSTSLALAVTAPTSGIGTPYQPITLTASLTGTGCTGTLTLQIDGVFAGVQPASATVAFTLSGGVSPGFHTALATYSGSGTCSPSTATLLFSAAGATPSTATLALNATTVVLNQPVVLTAQVTGTAGGAVPTGSVLFFDGSTLLGRVVLAANGFASFTTSSLALGKHTLTADYAGDGTYSTSISPAQSVTIIYPGDYTLTVSPTPTSIQIGTVGTLTLTATPSSTALGGAYAGSIGVSCSGLPIYATCAFAPSTIVLDGTGKAMTSTLSIITQSQFAYDADPSRSTSLHYAWLPAGVLVILLGTGGLKRRQRLCLSARLLSVAAFLGLGLLVTGLTACGSHAPLATPSGTYTVTVSGIGAGNVNHSVTVQVTLHP